MKITILCVGKLKESFFRDAVNEYKKRISRYVKLDIVEVADEKTPDGASEREEQMIRAKEGARLLQKIRSEDYVVELAIGGRSFDSLSFSRKIEAFGTNGGGNLIFVIGGSLGLAGEVSERADEAISFSELTFPHQLMRVILLEQIYRSYKIMKNEPYHK